MIDVLKKNYEYKDGELFRKTTAGGQKIGSLVGWITTCNKKQYRKMNVGKKTIYVHQAIFMLHHGYLPKYIDHIDGNSLNNKIENLRQATQSQNLANSGKRSINTSGYKGVSYRKDTQKWIAQITVNRKHISLGCYKSPQEAHLAYQTGSKKYFGEFAKHE